MKMINFLAAAAGVLCAVSLQAQEGRPEHRGFPEPVSDSVWVVNHTQEMVEKYNLTPEQESQVRELNLQYADKLNFKGMRHDMVVETRAGTSITIKLNVTRDKPVFNEEAGEKISASDFLLDLSDIDELDDVAIETLASAEAWDAESDEPISIKSVEHEIAKEIGTYPVTFTTAGGTSITVNAVVKQENRVEDKEYGEEIYAMNIFKKVEDLEESIALDTDLELWANASAWSLEDGEKVEITDVKYDFDPDNIKPGIYDVTFSTEGYEYLISSTRPYNEGDVVGLVFKPQDIHLMKKEN